MSSPAPVPPLPVDPPAALEPEARPQGRAVGILYAVTVFVGAALLFGIQPLAARALLPTYGGSSSVWTLCLLFFQAALLLGYGWAHLSLYWLTERRQAGLQLALLVFAVVFSVSPAALAVEPREGSLAWSLVVGLSAGIGVTYVVLSTSSPLLSRWYAARAGTPWGVYWLYSASNAGSLGSLLAYPLFVERRWPLARQFELLRWGVGLYALLMLACAVSLWSSRPRDQEAVLEGHPAGHPAAAEPLTFRRRLRWIGLAALPSSLLSSLTAHLTTDIASSPLLWVIPLSLYLLSFVLIYRTRPLVTVAWSARAVPLAAMAGMLIFLGRLGSPGWLLLIAGLFLTFVASCLCHGLLYEDRPHETSLTDFYLMCSVGGALGGAFNALLAPLIFDDRYELPLGILALVAVRSLATVAPEATSLARDATHAGAAFAAGLVAVALARFLPPALREQPLPILIVAVLVVYRTLAFPRRFALGMAALLAVGLLLRRTASSTLFEARSFYGPLRVEETTDRATRQLRHGITLHGLQRVAVAERTSAYAYFHRDGPFGDVVRAAQAREVEPGVRIGVVGLGVGTMATSARPGERWVFYELDPLVVRIAEDTSLFTYLADARARGADVSTIVGDARQQLQREPDGGFSWLALDAFSSDSIPLHLVTREAFTLYLRKVRPGGFAALHVSNLHLDLPPIVGATAESLGFAVRCRTDARVSPAELARGRWPSTWCVLSATPGDLLLDAEVWRRPTPSSHVWRDENASVLDAVIPPWR